MTIRKIYLDNDSYYTKDESSCPSQWTLMNGWHNIPIRYITLGSEIDQLLGIIVAYQDHQNDVKKLTRELDVELNGGIL